MAASTKDLVNRFIKLDTQIKKKEGEVEKLKEDRSLLEAELMPRFEQAGIASMKSTSKVTVYVRRELWAGAMNKDTEALCAAIKSVPEIAPMVQEKVNSQTLSAYVRECAKNFFGDEAETKKPDEMLIALPIALRSVVSITEKYSLRSRRG